MFLRLMAAASLSAFLFANGAALAQWSPSATMNLGMGMGAIALGQSTLQGTMALDDETAQAPVKGKAVSPAVQQNDTLSPTMQRYCDRWTDEPVCQDAPALK